MSKKPVLILLGILVLLVGGFFIARRGTQSSGPVPTPTEEPVMQLEPSKHPRVSLKFRSDGHYVTVNIENLYASALEYNLIYEATVKNNKLQTGVNAAAQLEGKSTYSKEQLLGSESSGKFTYHSNITNAVMELTLRDEVGRSVFTATYPFEVSPGDTISLTPTS